MMTEMFLFACVESGPVVTTVPSIETTTAPDSGGKELRANVNLRPLLCSESECVCVGGGGVGEVGEGPSADILDL